MGKTSLKLCMARAAALESHKKVAIFSMEMVNDEIATSFLSQHSGIDSQRIESGAISDHEWPKLTTAIEELSAADVYIDDTPGLTPAALRAKCLNRKHIHGLDLVVVDYIQLMSAGVKMNTREQEVSYISRQIKLLANELKAPVLCGCQLNRASESRSEKRPQLSDLRESGALEQDADIVMMLHRPDQYEKDSGKQNVTEVNIAKHRKGPTGSTELIFRSSIVKFENAVTKTVQFKEEF
jgi:replicative DNA helicase